KQLNQKCSIYYCNLRKNSVSTSKQSVNEHIKIENYDGVKASREMLIGNYMKLGLKEEASKEAQLILDKSFKLES
ncbi:hypothetical protein, partial [Lactobacillus helveticus]|uniref:hypothetical protein n=1 Tax=Lactobacillus helveticus TaxID=1587 RepID=UPI001562353D